MHVGLTELGLPCALKLHPDDERLVGFPADERRRFETAVLIASVTEVVRLHLRSRWNVEGVGSAKGPDDIRLPLGERAGRGALYGRRVLRQHSRGCEARAKRQQDRSSSHGHALSFHHIDAHPRVKSGAFWVPPEFPPLIVHDLL